MPSVPMPRRVVAILCPCGSRRKSRWEYDTDHEPIARVCNVCALKVLGKMSRDNFKAEDLSEEQ